MKSTPPDTDILSNFGETLSELMFDAHLTPEALSKAIGAGLSVIYRYLRKEQLPTLQRALAIADLFACSLDYLFGLSHAEPHMTYRPAPPFAERFRTMLAQHGQTRYYLAKKTQFSAQTLDDWYHGKRQPGMESVIALAEHFHCSLDELLGRES